MRNHSLFISVIFYGGKYGKHKKTKKVEKSQKGYLTNERYQDFAEEQFKTIYEYLDKIAKKLN